MVACAGYQEGRIEVRRSTAGQRDLGPFGTREYRRTLSIILGIGGTLESWSHGKTVSYMYDTSRSLLSVFQYN